MKVSFILIAVFLSAPVHAQNFASDFGKHLQSRDTAAQSIILQQWQQTNPHDPELYTALFNYYILKGTHKIQPDQKTSNTHTLEIGSKQGVKGHIHGRLAYDSACLVKAFNAIDRGILLFPSRLDMRFGKIYMLEQTYQNDQVAQEVIKAVQQSGKNNNKWLWTDDRFVDNPREFFFENIQTYIGHMFNQGDDQGKNIKIIANEILKLHPDHIVSLSNLGISYIFESDFRSSLTPLLKAEKLSPGDPIVLGNIAYAYRNLGDKKKALEYYNKVLAYGDEEQKAEAAERINEIRRDVYDRD